MLMLIISSNSQSAFTCSKSTIEKPEQCVYSKWAFNVSMQCVYSNLKLQTSQRRHGGCSDVFIVKFEQVSHSALVF